MLALLPTWNEFLISTTECSANSEQSQEMTEKITVNEDSTIRLMALHYRPISINWPLTIYNVHRRVLGIGFDYTDGLSLCVLENNILHAEYNTFSECF